MNALYKVQCVESTHRSHRGDSLTTNPLQPSNPQEILKRLKNLKDKKEFCDFFKEEFIDEPTRTWVKNWNNSEYGQGFKWGTSTFSRYQVRPLMEVLITNHPEQLLEALSHIKTKGKHLLFIEQLAISMPDAGNLTNKMVSTMKRAITKLALHGQKITAQSPDKGSVIKETADKLKTLLTDAESLILNPPYAGNKNSTNLEQFEIKLKILSLLHSKDATLSTHRNKFFEGFVHMIHQILGLLPDRLNPTATNRFRQFSNTTTKNMADEATEAMFPSH
jgi:hypothetical protein